MDNFAFVLELQYYDSPKRFSMLNVPSQKTVLFLRHSRFALSSIDVITVNYKIWQSAIVKCRVTTFSSVCSALCLRCFAAARSPLLCLLKQFPSSGQKPEQLHVQLLRDVRLWLDFATQSKRDSRFAFVTRVNTRRLVTM